MASEGLECFDDEWDADLLDQLVQAEERALSTQPHNAPPPQFDVTYSPLENCRSDRRNPTLRAAFQIVSIHLHPKRPALPRNKKLIDSRKSLVVFQSSLVIWSRNVRSLKRRDTKRRMS